jgi:hypothetical protein
MYLIREYYHECFFSLGLALCLVHFNFTSSLLEALILWELFKEFSFDFRKLRF